MAVRLNYTIVAARDKDSAAKFLTEILGLPCPPCSARLRWCK
jgi:hypothetical protein